MSLKKLSKKHQVADERQILVTEVTRMNDGIVCVAGLDIHSQNMIRPLTSDGSNWDEAEWVDKNFVIVGNILSLKPSTQTNPDYPHASEDFRVSHVTRLAQATDSELYSACLETADDSVDALFDGNVVENKYVIEKTKCRSLGCVAIPGNELRLSDKFDKVQISYQDHFGTWHNLKVTDLTTKSLGSATKGMEYLKGLIENAGHSPCILRIGLARAWDGPNQSYDPKRCYLQLNGLIFPA